MIPLLTLWIYSEAFEVSWRSRCGWLLVLLSVGGRAEQWLPFDGCRLSFCVFSALLWFFRYLA